MPDPTIDLRSLREQVYDHLKRRLNEGGLVPGAFLDLNAIAAEIGISRTPLRDALLHLESEGFVEILPRRGVRVVELTLERIRDLYEIDDFAGYYSANLEFHDGYLELSMNAELRRTVRTCKQRLYDFPRHRRFVKEWELASTEEHAAIVGFLTARDVDRAADFVREVHWSFAVQEPFIKKYYLARNEETAPSGRG